MLFRIPRGQALQRQLKLPDVLVFQGEYVRLADLSQVDDDNEDYLDKFAWAQSIGGLK